jgi:hypothetical protein
MANKLNTLLFSISLLGAALFYFILPKEKISVEEKRKLAVIPKLTFDSYLNGNWSDSMDHFVDDQFPFRTTFIEMADVFHSLKGIKLVHQAKIFVAKKKDEKFEDTAHAKINYLQNFQEDYSGSLLIIDGSVYPMSGGIPSMAASYSAMVNEYALMLKGKTRVLSAVAPLSSAFIPVLKYRKYNSKNKETLTAIKNSLNNEAIFCDVFNELDKHADEKLFFSTDHHWNAKGAYYAYVAFCQGAGIAPIELNKMEKRTKYNFLGSLYQLTRDPSVKANPDSMEYFIPRVKTTAVRYGKNNFENPIKANVFSHQNSGGNSYLTFLGGDAPLIKITTDVKNGRKAVVVKNSMGNAFAVFLISHYEEIYVVDFRYSNHNMLKIIENNKVNDLIFALGMYGALSKGTINMMRNLATNNGIVKLKPLTKEDSTQIFNPILDTLKTD